MDLQFGLWAVLGTVGAVLLLLGASATFTVGQGTVAIVTRFGRLVRVAAPGLNFRIPLFEQVAGHLDLSLQEHKVTVETMTADNATVQVVVAVQYYVLKERAGAAFYVLQNPTTQVASFVQSVVLAHVPTLRLDDVFTARTQIAHAVREGLRDSMDEYGYGIANALVTSIDPAASVKDAMNAISAATRNRIAAVEQAEAERLRLVKAAEAEAEAKALQGKGVAQQRAAIIEGLRQSVAGFEESVPGVGAQEALRLVLLTQYFDSMRDIAAASETKTILVPHSPGAVRDLEAQLRDAFFVGGELNGPHRPRQGAIPGGNGSASGQAG